MKKTSTDWKWASALSRKSFFHKPAFFNKWAPFFSNCLEQILYKSTPLLRDGWPLLLAYLGSFYLIKYHFIKRSGLNESMLTHGKKPLLNGRGSFCYILFLNYHLKRVLSTQWVKHHWEGTPLSEAYFFARKDIYKVTAHRRTLCTLYHIWILDEKCSQLTDCKKHHDDG